MGAKSIMLQVSPGQTGLWAFFVACLPLFPERWSGGSVLAEGRWERRVVMNPDCFCPGNSTRRDLKNPYVVAW